MSPLVRPSPRAGWTLLELTIAIAIALLIVGIGSAAFRIPYQSLARLSGPLPRDAEALRIFREDISGLAALPGSKLPALSLSAPNATPGDPLVLDLVCARRTPTASDPLAFSLYQISHRFEVDTGNPPERRWIRRSRKVGEERVPPREEILTEGMTNITVEAWTGNVWTNQWIDTRSHRLPPALRIELQRGDQTETLIAPIPAGFTAEPERASPTSRATSGPNGQHTVSRQTDARPYPVHSRQSSDATLRLATAD